MDSADISITLFIYTCSNLLDIRIMNSINKFQHTRNTGERLSLYKVNIILLFLPRNIYEWNQKNNYTIFPFAYRGSSCLESISV